MNETIQVRKFWAVLSVGVAVVACTEAQPNESVASNTEQMSYDFWLNTPASAPVFANPFGAGQPAGAGVATFVADPASAWNCRECSHTKSANVAHSQVSTAAASSAYANTLWAHGGANSIRTKFNGAVPIATGHFNAGYASSLSNTINNIETWLKQWPGVTAASVVKTGGAPAQWFRAFNPIQTRALVVDGAVYHHPQPFWLEEMRYRGARTYCALREAARQQDSSQKYSLGSNGTTKFIEWALGGSEATVAIGPSWKDIGSPVANVFVVPLAVGTRLEPIKGPLVPSVGQIVHPVSWISADSLLVSYENGSTKAYVNSQHADAFVGQSVSGSVVGTNLPIMSYGFISVTGNFTFNAEFGTLLPNSGVTGGFASELTTGRGFLNHLRSHKMDKLLGANYRPSAVATDAPFLKDGWLMPIENDGTLSTFKFYDLPGVGTRLRAEDDRAITVGDRVQESLGLTYGGGFSLASGVLTVNVGVSGNTSINLDVQRMTTIRDQVSSVATPKLSPAAPDMTPPVPGGVNFTGQSNILVIPEAKTIHTLNPLTVTAQVQLVADLGFFQVNKNFSQTIYKAPDVTLGSSAKTIGAEPSRLRVGTFTDFGFEYGTAAQNTRSTYSHLPHPNLVIESSIPSFPSFPDPGIDSVPACLADTSNPGNPPPPFQGGTGTNPEMRLCVYGPGCPGSLQEGSACIGDLWGIPSNICSTGSIPNYLAQTGFTGAQYTCMNAVLSHYCDPAVTPPPKVQQWANAGNVIARSVNQQSIVQVQSQCLAAFSAGASSQAEVDWAAEIVGALFHYALCDSTWAIQGQQAL